MTRRLVGRIAHALILAAIPAASGAQPPSAPAAAPLRDAAALGRLWDDERLLLPAPPLLRHADLVQVVENARRRAADWLRVEEIGQSVEGRAIYHLSLGQGPRHVLLWSQMHGDEPTATVALFDLIEYLRRHRAEPAVARTLDALTLHIVPMLNPDGAERAERRNAQGIDINRDALHLQTPEGRALKALRDRVQPEVGFNLHNQDWRTSVGGTDRPAAISLLSVAFDEAGSDNPGRVLTKKLCALIRDAVEALAPGLVARYDDTFELRAFGDNLTKWGTSVVLIETGPYPSPDPDTPLVRLNFVALVTALEALASGAVDAADPGRYESLPLNERRVFHMLVRNASIVIGTGIAAFTGDIGIEATRMVTAAGQRTVRFAARIADIGDLRTSGALESIDGSGLTVVPRFIDVAVGEVVTLPPSLRLGGRTIAVGQPADLLLLRPLEGGQYRVERVVNGS